MMVFDRVEWWWWGPRYNNLPLQVYRSLPPQVCALYVLYYLSVLHTWICFHYVNKTLDGKSDKLLNLFLGR